MKPWSAAAVWASVGLVALLGMGCLSTQPAEISPTAIPPRSTATTLAEPASSLSPQPFLPARPVALSIAADTVPAEGLLTMAIDLACEPPARIDPVWAGSILTPEFELTCSTPLTGRTQQLTLTFVVDPADKSSGFYILEVGSLRYPFTIRNSRIEAAGESSVSKNDPGEERPTGSGKISGRVWHDACQNDAVEAKSLTGCIRLGTDSTLVSNGRLDEGEEGISQLLISLYEASCESQPRAQVVSDRAGDFVFDGLPAGTYCVEIDSEGTHNRVILQPGRWRRPAVETLSAVQTVTIKESEELSLLFGWDYSRLPRQSAAEICQNKGWVTQEGLLPAGAQVTAGERAVKSWKIENIGTCSWTAAYKLAPLDANGVVNIEAAVPIEAVIPSGESAQLAVELTVPTQLGRWRQRWVLLDDKNNPFGVGLAEERPLTLDLTVVSP